mmetsp:Transcript_11298/g.38596  ORF Transcript_11298/g.38596 Transcript_11298/m.38596 type:complete len:286 (+) Transcript_11298:134-991(+)
MLDWTLFGHLNSLLPALPRVDWDAEFLAGENKPKSPHKGSDVLQSHHTLPEDVEIRVLVGEVLEGDGPQDALDDVGAAEEVKVLAVEQKSLDRDGDAVREDGEREVEGLVLDLLNHKLVLSKDTWEHVRRDQAQHALQDSNDGRDRKNLLRQLLHPRRRLLVQFTAHGLRPQLLLLELRHERLSRLEDRLSCDGEEEEDVDHNLVRCQGDRSGRGCRRGTDVPAVASAKGDEEDRAGELKELDELLHGGDHKESFSLLLRLLFLLLLPRQDVPVPVQFVFDLAER